MKCVDYLGAVVSVDVVTDRHAVLHNDPLQRLGAPPALELAEGSRLYAASHRPVLRDNRPEIDIWVNGFAVGDTLPTMPLRLIADYFVPAELELTYTDACGRRRLIGMGSAHDDEVTHKTADADSRSPPHRIGSRYQRSAIARRLHTGRSRTTKKNAGHGARLIPGLS